MTMSSIHPVLANSSNRSTVVAVARIAAMVSSLLLPLAATAEPVTLKLSFFTSDRSFAYQAAVKPFVDAINADGKGRSKLTFIPVVRLAKFRASCLSKSSMALPISPSSFPAKSGAVSG